jgi:Mlc titration factor MtfA (ptsG expression regulator)
VEASHVGIHEFAHVLDPESGDFDGVPLGFERQRIRAWESLRRREERRIHGATRNWHDPKWGSLTIRTGV